MRLICLLFSALFICSSVFSQITTEEHFVYFNVDKFNITPIENEKLETFCKGNIPLGATILLSGHTDTDGNDDYNLELSCKRVMEVHDWLVAQGYSKTNISTDFRGEKDLYKSETTSKDKQLNRRVVVRYSLPKVKEEIKEKEKTIEDLYKLTKLEFQTFCVDPSRDTVLILKDSTIFLIRAHTFQTNSKNCITINAKEVLSYSDMLLENLSTSSNGEQLETGGMIYIEAKTSTGSPVKIAKGKSIEILVPTDTLDNRMQLFNGERDGHDVMNWLSADQLARGFNRRNNPGIDLSCSPCTFFFCRIGRTGKVIKGMFVKSQREENRAFRNCLKGNKKSRNKYGIGWFEYNDSIQKGELDRISAAYENGDVGFNDVSYYAFNITKMGWINCDAFSNFPESKKISMVIDEKYSSQLDVKVVFKKIKSIMPSYPVNGFPQLDRVPRGEEVVVVAIKYIKDEIHLALKETTVQPKISDLEFKIVTLEELKTALKKLD